MSPPPIGSPVCVACVVCVPWSLDSDDPMQPEKDIAAINKTLTTGIVFFIFLHLLWDEVYRLRNGALSMRPLALLLIRRLLSLQSGGLFWLWRGRVSP